MTVILYLCAALSFAFSLACFLPSFSLQSMAFPLAAIASGVTLALVILLLRKPDRRITSYNVCYTKLLRASPDATGGAANGST